MLRAIHRESIGSVIEVPESLDDTDGLQRLRIQFDERVASGQYCLHLDCSRLKVISCPALGWILECARRLSLQGGEIILLHVRTPVFFQFRSLGPELRGITLQRASASSTG